MPETTAKAEYLNRARQVHDVLQKAHHPMLFAPYLVPTRDIEQGQELYLRYGDGYWDSWTPSPAPSDTETTETASTETASTDD